MDLALFERFLVGFFEVGLDSRAVSFGVGAIVSLLAGAQAFLPFGKAFFVELVGVDFAVDRREETFLFAATATGGAQAAHASERVTATRVKEQPLENEQRLTRCCKNVSFSQIITSFFRRFSVKTVCFCLNHL